MDDRFISEKNAEEVRKKRQEEWEKVRKANDPVGTFFLLLFVHVNCKNYF